MPITRLLQNSNLAPAEREILNLAFIRALRLLSLVDRNDAVCEIVAEKIMKVGATGASNPVAISETAARQLRGEYHCAKKAESAEPRRGFVTTMRRYILEIRKGISL
jgi:hypothetical protein